MALLAALFLRGPQTVGELRINTERLHRFGDVMAVEAFLRERLPERTWANRLVRDGGRCYLEFSAVDVDRMARLGIEVTAVR